MSQQKQQKYKNIANNNTEHVKQFRATIQQTNNNNKSNNNNSMWQHS